MGYGAADDLYKEGYNTGVKVERERCAKIAENYDGDIRTGDMQLDLRYRDFRAAIAAAIRNSDAVAAAIKAAELKVNASDVDPTAGLNPKFDWGGDP